MEFLDKLYESEYFGIGLFIVISFLVVTFLIVLFFGKKDEKKRKLEETNKLNIEKNTTNTFVETSVETPVEMPVMPSLEPVAPVNFESVETQPSVDKLVNLESATVAPIEPMSPINFDSSTIVEPEIINMPVEPISIESVPVVPIEPVAPVKYENIIDDSKTDIINETIEPIKLETVSVPPIESIIQPVVEEPVINKQEIVIPPIEEIKIINNDSVVQPVSLEPIKFEVPKTENAEVNKIDQVILEPLIKEETEPIITHIEEIIPKTPEVKEAEIPKTYYEPIEKAETEDIKVPNLDFDTLAETISKELDELERNTFNKYEQVKTYNNINRNQFSSVYVTEPVKQTASPKLDMPTKIELPSLKSDEIEPESYNL
ncbi:MAG: hypothetical protein E7163_01690 [Firmicutes bacterium]|nr:hypothetical protein [Bacillota bacterium]